jgi:hypothetical protein
MNINAHFPPLFFSQVNGSLCRWRDACKVPSPVVVYRHAHPASAQTAHDGKKQVVQ